MKVSENNYKIIELHSQLYCTDIVIFKEDSGNKKILGVLRGEEPAKNLWYPIGGRIWKGEEETIAAKRKAREEINVEIEIIKKIGLYRTLYSEGHFGKEGNLDSLNIVFLAKLKEENSLINIDRTSQEYKWFEIQDKNISPYLKKIAFDSKIFLDLKEPTNEELLKLGLIKFDKIL